MRLAWLVSLPALPSFHRLRSVGVVLLVFWAGLGSLWARSLVIESFDVQIQVQGDGSIRVIETIRPRFTGSWNGIYREIPVEYRTPQGFNKTLFLDGIWVEDGNGKTLETGSSRRRHYRRLKIRVPGARDAIRTVKIHYRVPNALLYFDEHDELYWNVTGDEWEVPIEAASAVIYLPPAATGVRAVAFTGPYGSRAQDVDVSVRGNEIRLRTGRGLGYREGLTVVAGWDKGAVQSPGAVSRAWLFLRSNWPFALPLAVLALMSWLWYSRGRDPSLRPIAVRYEPPEGLSPAEAGTLVDNQVDMRDITASLVDLAVRGHLVIEEKQHESWMGLWTSPKYVFHKQSSKKERNGLQSHEKLLLQALFRDGDRVQLSDLENKFYKELPEIRDRIYDALMAHRCFHRRPDKVKRVYLIAAAVVAVLVVGGGSGLAGSMGMATATWIVSGLLCAASVAGFGWFMPARTKRGTRTLEALLGFQEFIQRVESDRFERVVKSPALFERYLPFAMALGLERRWVAAFDEICKEPPTWYRGGDTAGFRASHFAQNMNQMSTAAASAMTSAPRSSGGSGFGGGGFSGGGVGGGGGGGW